MNLTAYLTGGALLAVAVIYGVQELRVRSRDVQIEAAGAILDVAVRDKAEAIAASQANAAVAETRKKELERQALAFAKTQADDRKRTARLAKLQKEITNASGQDTPVPDAVERVLDSLRVDGPSVAPADSADKDPNRKADDPGSEPRVPAEAAPAS